jgi:uncharacterized protein (TIGR02452 family)
MAARDVRSRHKNSRKRKDGGKGSTKFYIHVYQDTQTFFAKEGLTAPVGSVITRADFDLDLMFLNQEPTTGIEIQDEDTLAMAERYRSEGMSVLVLNMASASKPGGGVGSGKSAQEESIFRRTNAFMTHNPAVYPLAPDQAFYSPEVRVIKNETYEFIKSRHHYTVGLISVPALKDPEVSGDDYKNPADRALMQAKINLIFECGIAHGYQSMVLGALGCGVYNNPPRAIVEMFTVALQTYGGFFKKIGFAILSVGRNGTANYKLFTSSFGLHK